jgi:hypothetical protein
MNRYRTYGPMDDVPELAGDAQFIRLDMRSDPSSLPPGVVQRSENFRFDKAGAQVRAGIARQFAPGSNTGTILWVATYRPDSSNDRFALVTSSALVLFNPADQTLQFVYYPSGETVAAGAPVDFLQGGIGSGTTPTAWILRGLGKDALKFDGATVTGDAAFKRGNFGLFVQDRMAVNDTAQSVAASDFLDFAVWSALSQFKVEWGGNDYLVAFYPYQKDIVIIAARKQILIAFFDPTTNTGGYTGGLNANTSFMRVLTREAGVVGRRAIKEAAGLIWFVSDNAVYAFQPQLDLELTVLGKPVSADIQPIMDRLSAKYASNAVIERWGYRLYFALPISDEPVSIVLVDVVTSSSVGIDLPFDLPALLANGGLASFTVETAHNLATGDRVFITGMVDALLNGEFEVASAPDDTHFTVVTSAVEQTTEVAQATVQRIALRNNTIAVLNLNNRDAEHPVGMWESIDRLPPGFYADFLMEADFGSTRRLWVIDRDAGPALYEQGEADEISSVLGGVDLPFDLPVELSTANFGTAPIAGRLTGRQNSFGQFAREIRYGRARLTLKTGDAGTLTLTVETPDADVWTEVPRLRVHRHSRPLRPQTLGQTRTECPRGNHHDCRTPDRPHPGSRNHTGRASTGVLIYVSNKQRRNFYGCLTGQNGDEHAAE